METRECAAYAKVVVALNAKRRENAAFGVMSAFKDTANTVVDFFDVGIV